MDNETDDKIIKLEKMKEMSIDQIIELYKNGYRIENAYQIIPASTIETVSNGITVSSDALLLVGIGVLAYLFITNKI